MNRIILLSLILLMTVVTLYGQVDSLQSYYTKSIEAYKKKDYATYLNYAEKFNKIHPSHPVMTYNLASAYALSGNFEQAKEMMKKSIVINADRNFDEDPDFRNMKESFTHIEQFKLEMTKLIKSGEEFQLPVKIHGETIAFIPELNKFIIGTVNRPEVLLYSTTDNSVETLISFTVEKPFAYTSSYYDPENHTIWLTGNAMPQTEGFREELKDYGRILSVDLQGNILTVNEYADHQFQDILIADGKLFVSDGLQNKIFMMDESGKLEEWKDLSSEAFNLQSMAYNSKDNMLYVADYLKGIIAVDIKTKKHALMIAKDEYLILKGIDGLEFYDNALYAVHNGVNPKRIVKYNIRKKIIKDYKILNQNDISPGEPTTGVLVNNNLYYIANSPWHAYEGNQFVPEKVMPLIIKKINLN